MEYSNRKGPPCGPFLGSNRQVRLVFELRTVLVERHSQTLLPLCRMAPHPEKLSRQEPTTPTLYVWPYRESPFAERPQKAQQDTRNTGKKRRSNIAQAIFMSRHDKGLYPEKLYSKPNSRNSSPQSRLWLFARQYVP